MIRQGTLLSIGNAIAQASGGAIRVAYAEEDDSTNPAPHAGHFLKIRDKRVGQDFETYELTAKLAGWGSVLTALYTEIFVPLRASGIEACTNEASQHFLVLGYSVLPESSHLDWDNLFGKNEHAALLERDPD